MRGIVRFGLPHSRGRCRSHCFLLQPLSRGLVANLVESQLATLAQPCDPKRGKKEIIFFLARCPGRPPWTDRGNLWDPGLTVRNIRYA